MSSSAFSSSASEIDSAAEQILASLMQEESLRKRQADANPYARWFSDPIGFTEDHLLGFLWSKQKDVCRSVARDRRTAVKSCHDVGKTRTAATLAAWWLSTRKKIVAEEQARRRSGRRHSRTSSLKVASAA
jgi:hypothetical protein